MPTRLKRLELYGYKSFAARSAFEFGEGITAIVGPNGSGKSNIADAVRWVLGEQNYRTLRAKTTEDMIFAGTRNRPRLGMAEVLVTLDNSDRWLPLDFTEVTIGRRSFRSGENEYLLNGNRVRLLDIVNLLGGSGLMRSSYLVIGQGLVDAALSLRPEARRVLFEEAAGIAPHLRKRSEGLRRIEETERNLERVSDILNELQPRALSLRRQSERAEEHALLSQDIKELQRIWYGYHWQRRQKQLLHIQERLKEEQVRVNGQRNYTHDLQQRLDEIRAQQSGQRQASENLSSRRLALRNEQETLRRDLAVVDERMRLYRQQRESLDREMGALSRRSEILRAEVDRTTRELVEQETLLAASQNELAEARRELGLFENTRAHLERQIREQEGLLAPSTTTISQARARLEQLQERRETLAAERDSAHHRLASLEKDLGEHRAAGQQLAEQEQALLRHQTELRSHLEEIEREIADTRDRARAVEQEVTHTRAERDRLSSRHELLTRLQQELTGYYPGVREVLGPQAGLRGLLGTVANLMQVPEELERAIESALGPRLQNVIAERWADAEAAIAHLKRTHGGWATFLPLDTVRSRPPMDMRPDSGILGVASKLVRFDDHLRPVYELLLGSVVLVRDLDCARRLLGRRTGAALLVTLEGETVQPSGALSGGTRKESGNLLAQERERRLLPEQIQQIENELGGTLLEYAKHQTRLQDLQQQVQETERKLGLARSEHERAANAAGRHTGELRELEREQGWRTERARQVSDEIATLTTREASLRDALQGAQRQQVETMERLRALREQLTLLEDNAQRQQVGELETRIAVTLRTVQSHRTLLQSHRANMEDLNRQIDAKGSQHAELGQELEELAETKTNLEKRLLTLDRQSTDLKQQFEPLQKDLARLEHEYRETERQHHESTERLNEAELEFNRITLEREHLREEQQALVHEIEADLGPIDLPGFVSHQLRLDLGDDIVELPTVDVLPTGLGEEISQLRARLRRLGNVNPEAPREYEQLLERQTFLQSQRTDLRGAISALREVIQELDAVIEHDFVATLEKVDQSFSVYFGALFGGGSAHLELTDPENLSSSGVDIVVHPPGKRAQNLSLLSGGERALTAAALLFALLSADPVPFCFLDEVDAALDEANVGRFRDLLREHARSTQFVVITHNRNTIEAASTIYGISMGEQGVSQCISLKLPPSRSSSEPVHAVEAQTS